MTNDEMEMFTANDPMDERPMEKGIVFGFVEKDFVETNAEHDFFNVMLYLDKNGMLNYPVLEERADIVQKRSKNGDNL